MFPHPPIHSIASARMAARRRMPRMMFDYVDGAAGAERAKQRNYSALDNILLLPRVLVEVEQRRLDCRLFDRHWNSPFGIAPMGMCNLAWPGADDMLANIAVQHGIPIALSTMASSSIEQMRQLAGEQAWFQLYVGGSPEHATNLINRAQAAGYDTLILTVDVPQVPQRPRDLRNGFTVPFKLGLRQFIDFARHPGWSIATLRAGKPVAVNALNARGEPAFDRYADRGGIDWDYLKKLRQQWPGHLIVKGVLCEQDALRIKQQGADAIYVSNHGGRQLDSAPSALSRLPRIRRAVGADFPLLFDSGIRSGEDIVKALALGADFVLLGRAFLYALGARSAAGLDTVVNLLRQDMLSCMAQLGVNRIDELGQAHVAARPDAVDGSPDSNQTSLIE